MYYDLKKIMKERGLDLEKCLSSTDNMMQEIVRDIFTGTCKEQLQVALVSSVINVADLYKCKDFSILLMKSALAQLESEAFIESGGKLH